MSYTTMHLIDAAGVIQCSKHYQNSFGWAAMVWRVLVERYAGHGVAFDAWKTLWDWHASKRIVLQPWEANVLVATYDNVVVKREGFPALANSLMLFFEAYHEPGRSNHCCAMADDILEAPETVEAICWNATSVNSDPWWEYDDAHEEYVQYDFLTGEKHWIATMENVDQHAARLSGSLHSGDDLTSP